MRNADCGVRNIEHYLNSEAPPLPTLPTAGRHRAGLAGRLPVINILYLPLQDL
jgi:hypothetical protein